MMQCRMASTRSTVNTPGPLISLDSYNKNKQNEGKHIHYFKVIALATIFRDLARTSYIIGGTCNVRRVFGHTIYTKNYRLEKWFPLWGERAHS